MLVGFDADLIVGITLVVTNPHHFRFHFLGGQHPLRRDYFVTRLDLAAFAVALNFDVANLGADGDVDFGHFSRMMAGYTGNSDL